MQRCTCSTPQVLCQSQVHWTKAELATLLCNADTVDVCVLLNTPTHAPVLCCSGYIFCLLCWWCQVHAKVQQLQQQRREQLEPSRLYLPAPWQPVVFKQPTAMYMVRMMQQQQQEPHIVTRVQQQVTQ